MHEHEECEHELKYCSHCDVVYCVKCEREWGKEKIVYVEKKDTQWPWPTPIVTFDSKPTCAVSHHHIDMETE